MKRSEIAQLRLDVDVRTTDLELLEQVMEAKSLTFRVERDGEEAALLQYDNQVTAIRHAT